MERDIENLVIPQHVALILDGNGRWAKKRGLPRTVGHKQGCVTVEQTVEDAARLGIRYLTVYGFSTENWKRSPTFPATHLRRFMLYAGFAGKTLKLRSVRPAGNLSPPFPLCGQQQRLLFFVSVFDRFSVFQYMHARGKHFVHYTRIRHDLYSENLS